MESAICIYVGGTNVLQGGAEQTHTYGIVNEFAQRFPVHFIAGYSANSKYLELKFDNNPDSVNYLKVKSGVLGQIMYEFRVKCLLKKIIKKAKGKHCFIYSRYRLTSFFMAFYIKNFTKFPFFVEYNDIASVQIDWGIENKLWSKPGCFIRKNMLFKKLLKLSEKYIFSNATGVIAITEPIKKYILSISQKTNVKVIGNGSNPDKIIPLNKQQCRKNLNLDAEGFYFCHIGTLTCWDGLEDVLNAWKRVKETSHLEVYLIIAGDGHEKKKIMNIMKKRKLTNIIMTGEISNKKALEYLGASDVGLLLKTINDYGLSPIKLFEYMAAGKPILSSNINEINMVKRYKSGLVADLPLSTGQIANLMLSFTTMTTNELDKMGNQNRKLCIDKFSWNKRAEEIIEFLQPIIIQF